jgi:hypothetical protein
MKQLLDPVEVLRCECLRELRPKRAALADQAIEQVGQCFRVLHHREVPAGDLDRLHPQQLAGDESLPVGLEELVVGCVDERRGNVGMAGERELIRRRSRGAKRLRELPRRVGRKARVHRLDRGLGIPDARAVRPARGERERLAEHPRRA